MHSFDLVREELKALAPVTKRLEEQTLLASLRESEATRVALEARLAELEAQFQAQSQPQVQTQTQTQGVKK
jgi:hypothetical protein